MFGLLVNDVASVQSRELIHGHSLSRSFGPQTIEDRTAVIEDKSLICEVLDEYKGSGNSSHQPRLTDGGSIRCGNGLLWGICRKQETKESLLFTFRLTDKKTKTHSF